jgi:hypothetical protein
MTSGTHDATLVGGREDINLRHAGRTPAGQQPCMYRACRAQAKPSHDHCVYAYVLQVVGSRNRVFSMTGFCLCKDERTDRDAPRCMDGSGSVTSPAPAIHKPRAMSANACAPACVPDVHLNRMVNTSQNESHRQNTAVCSEMCSAQSVVTARDTTGDMRVEMCRPCGDHRSDSFHSIQLSGSGGLCARVIGCVRSFQSR